MRWGIIKQETRKLQAEEREIKQKVENGALFNPAR
jgi:hypothetical protein